MSAVEEQAAVGSGPGKAERRRRTEPGGFLSVNAGSDAWIPEIEPGTATTYELGDVEGTIFNGPTKQDSSIKVPANARSLSLAINDSKEGARLQRGNGFNVTAVATAITPEILARLRSKS